MTKIAAALLLTRAVAAGSLALSAISPAHAFMPRQHEITKATSGQNDVIEVKRSSTNPRPPGWNRGRKVGWHGGRRPPGQRR